MSDLVLCRTPDLTFFLFSLWKTNQGTHRSVPCASNGRTRRTRLPRVESDELPSNYPSNHFVTRSRWLLFETRNLSSIPSRVSNAKWNFSYKLNEIV